MRACAARGGGGGAPLGAGTIVVVGVVGGGGGRRRQRLIRAVGKAKAMDMVLTGRMINAEQVVGPCPLHRALLDDTPASFAGAGGCCLPNMARRGRGYGSFHSFSR